MPDDTPENWTIGFSADQVRRIKAFGHQVNSVHIEGDVEPPGLEVTVTLTSWSGPSAEVACGGARVDLGAVELIITGC
jgi:hypothetical protein